ncbi:hypothetical protein H5P28_08240 [Ruficoccus amylovorans]|uniref:Sialate O-acetylesterase domain-containing protein n=1 Tax=Ruficoccus amylovorans TaxID=1804625 RepID=A0A842HDF7_9BACT|nr:sialate O-acetylesterase [Ruficoccus amylovorans]MBC2594250.1 hypothetical protein [Ruficoccus amylovorans]
MKKLISLLLICVCGASAHAVLKLPRIFSDNMVLQAGEPVKIWGRATAGAGISVRLGEDEASAVADDEGRWSVELGPLTASKAPAVMRIDENGETGVEIANVLVGEVWMTGGQSNMELGIPSTSDWQRIKTEGDYPLIRYFWQPRTTVAAEPQEDFNPESKWLVCTPENLEKYRFHSVAVYFAEALMKDLDTPVGMISSAHGGTPMRAWVDQQTVSESEDFRAIWEDFLKRRDAYDYEAALKQVERTRADYEAKVAAAKAAGKPLPPRPFSISELHKPWPDSPDAFRTPAYLFNGKVAPAAGYTVRGFLWYQGENDAKAPSSATFDAQLKGLIGAWRRAWGDESLPFIFAQLPSYDSSEWEEVRQKQTAVFQNGEHIGMVVLIDEGEEKDIHPKNKTVVGRRMERIALKDVYGRTDINAYGPLIEEVDFQGKTAVLAFDLDGSHLRPVSAATGFEVLAADGTWKPAHAEVSGDSVIVRPEVSGKFTGVRYLYTPWAKPLASVFNTDGLPLAPFVVAQE